MCISYLLWRHGASLVRPGRRALRRSRRAFVGCLGVFVFSSSPHLRLHVPVRGALYSGLASVEPVLSLRGTLHGFPPSISPGSRLVRPSVYYLTDPSLAGTPRSGTSDRSSPVCLHHDPHREQQSCCYGVDSFIGNDRFTPSPLIRS